jgi:hypothetical protein
MDTLLNAWNPNLSIFRKLNSNAQCDCAREDIEVSAEDHTTSVVYDKPATMSGLFKGDMHRYGAMLITTLSLVVNGLSDIEDVQSAVWALDDRHFSYGVKPEYFPLFRESSIWLLGHHLRVKSTPEPRSAWIEASTR